MTSSNGTTVEEEERGSAAARWYVQHESDTRLSAGERREWQEWTANRANSAKFSELAEIHRRLVSLPRPSLPSASEICADAILPQMSVPPCKGPASKRFKRPILRQGALAACCAGLVLLGLLGGWFLGHRATEPSAIAKAPVSGEPGFPFSESTLEHFRASGRPVFVNLRASWCPTCTANERTVLARNPVQQLMSRKHVAYLTGDWTLQDPTISAELRRFGKNGVPLYLLFSPGSKEPLIFPQVLTEHVVLRELSSLPDPGASS
jgi:hypothetical protein